MTQISEYEVRCPSCDVSFPKGTKRCMHCGGRTGPSHLGGPRVAPRFSSDPFDPRAPEEGTRADDEFVRPLPVDFEPEDEKPSKAGGIVRAMMTLIWVGLAAALSMARACSEN